MNIPQTGFAPDRLIAPKPSREEAEAAVRTLLAWAGDDPGREGLLDTPARVARAWGEWFRGYEEDPAEMLARTFEEVEGYDDMVLLRDIRFESHCEHHLAPIIGRAHVAYLPTDRVVGISKLARVVDAFGKRLQVQEKMTAQIAAAIDAALARSVCDRHVGIGADGLIRVSGPSDGADLTMELLNSDGSPAEMSASAASSAAVTGLSSDFERTSKSSEL